MQVNTIIVGGGICGSLLGYYLQKQHQSFVIINETFHNTSSTVSSGVINPITGRRYVRTWNIETYLPFAVNLYKQIEKDWNVSLINQYNIIDFFTTPQMQLAFHERLATEQSYLSLMDNTNSLQQLFSYNFGVGQIQPCFVVNVPTLLQAAQKQFSQQNSYWQQRFEIEELKITPSTIYYKNISAKQIIFCGGVYDAKQYLFKNLPFAPNKGEALLVEINDLPKTNIYKQGISIVPWQDDIFWVGSNYTWSFDDAKPTVEFYNKTKAALRDFLKIPFTIHQHLASVRPATIERRPFVGFHPLYSNVGILNGMGSKGCSLAPVFAHQLAQNILLQKHIEPLANVERFKNILLK